MLIELLELWHARLEAVPDLGQNVPGWSMDSYHVVPELIQDLVQTKPGRYLHNARTELGKGGGRTLTMQGSCPYCGWKVFGPDLDHSRMCINVARHHALPWLDLARTMSGPYPRPSRIMPGACK